MVRILLFGNTLEVNIASAKGNKKMVITDGTYNNKKYHSLIVLGTSLILDGDEAVVVSECVAVDIKIKSVIDKLAEITGDNNVYILKMDAIPHGTERDLLQKLI